MTFEIQKIEVPKLKKFVFVGTKVAFFHEIMCGLVGGLTVMMIQTNEWRYFFCAIAVYAISYSILLAAGGIPRFYTSANFVE